MVVTLGGAVLGAAGVLLMPRFTGRDGLRRTAGTVTALVAGAGCVVAGAGVIVLGLRP